MQQKAGLKGQYFDGEVNGHEKTKEAQKENERIAAEKKDKQKEAYEEAKRRYNEAKKSKTTINYGENGITYTKTETQQDHTTVVKPVNPNLVQNNQQGRQ